MLLLLWALAHAEVVDRILHVVGDRVITTSDLVFEAELAAHDPSPVPPLRDPEYPTEERLVDMAVLRALAGDIALYEPTPAELRARGERVAASWDRPEDQEAFLVRWGLDEERLLGLLYSRMVVERYVVRNLALPAQDRPQDLADWRAVYQPWMAALRARVPVRTPG